MELLAGNAPASGLILRLGGKSCTKAVIGSLRSTWSGCWTTSCREVRASGVVRNRMPVGSAIPVAPELQLQAADCPTTAPAPAPAASQSKEPEFSSMAEARVLAVVGSGKMSPWGSASWKEVLEQMARKMGRADAGLEMVVLEDSQLVSLLAQGGAAALHQADMVVAVQVGDASTATHLTLATTHIPTLAAFDCHPSLPSRLGGVPVPSHIPLPSALDLDLFHWNRKQEAREKLRKATEIWHRKSSDNILTALQLLIDTYVTPVPSLQKLQARGLKFLQCATGNCLPELAACLTDPEARQALQCMQACDPTDQFGTYRCIAQHENSSLQALSLCLLQRHNCLDLSAQIPMHLAVSPAAQFRDQPMTHGLAEALLVGWARELGWSWKIAGNMFPIASQFRSQVQTFYREGDGTVWYDPVFQVSGKDGEAVWRRRHYTVRRAEQAGTFDFSFLDNGVMTREFWTIVEAAPDLSWMLSHSVGAAQRTGQTFTGAVVVTPDGAWPTAHLPRLALALERCDIKDWETLRVDHSSYAGAPRLGPPEHVPAQEFLGTQAHTIPHHIVHTDL